MKHEQRFKELHSDFQKRDFYVKREIETRTDQQIPHFQSYTKDMIQKLMEDNLIDKGPTFHSKKSK